MKKLFTFLTMLLLGIGSSWGAAFEVSNPVQVTDLSSLKDDAYYILQNSGTSKYNYYDLKNSRLDAKNTYDYSSVVRLLYDSSTGIVHIKQVQTGTYYQALVADQRVSLGASAVDYTFNIENVTAGCFRFANGDCFMNKGTDYPKGAGKNFTGVYSQWKIYKVEVSSFDGTITYSTTTGAYTATNSGGTWAQTWQAYGIGLKLSTGANNIAVSTGYIYSGSSTCTYTLTAPDGYMITGYTISGTAQTDVQTLTPRDGSGTSFATSGTTTLEVTNLATVQTSFTQSTPNKGIAISSFTVSLSPISAVTTLEGLSNSKKYNIINNRGNWAVADNATDINSTKKIGITPSPSDPKQQFAIISYEHNDVTKYYLYSVSEGKFAYVNGDKLSLSATITPTIINNPVTFTQSTYNSNMVVVLCVDDKAFGVHTTKNPHIWNYDNHPEDEGNASTICEAGDFDATDIIAAFDEYYSTTVKYVIKDTEGNTLLTSMEYSANVGDEITDESLPSECQRPFCSYDVEETTIVAGLNTVNVTATFNLPFTASTDFAHAKWYYIKMRSTKYAVYGETLPYQLTTTQDMSSKGCWAFMGNPYEGIRVINRAAGEGKYLQATANQPSMTTTPTYWTIGNQNGNFTLSESSKGYIHDISSNGKMVYWNNSDAATDDGSVFRIEEAEFTLVIKKTTGTYYLLNGTAISNPDETEDYWGPTWKSTKTVGDNNLLVMENSPQQGMNARTADIYTLSNGNATRYILTAATNYVIKEYSVEGTAKGTDITVSPRVRKNLTITENNEGSINVSNLELKTTSFGLSGANSTQGYLSGTISVTLHHKDMDDYTSTVENESTAAIGYKHIATTARYMTYMTKDAAGVVSPNQVGATFDEAPSTVAEFTFEYDSNIRAYYIKETSTNKYVYAKDDLTWADGSRNTTTNVAALGVENLPGDDEGKTLFQWLIYDGGTSVDQPSYYIRPKCNTNTAVSVQSMSDGILGFYDNTSKNYDFAHASLLTWEQLTTLYYNTTRDNNVKKAGKIGYPKTTSTEYTTLLGLLSTFTGGHTYTKSDYTNLLSYYDNYIAATDIVTPPANTFWRINSVLGENASLQAANASTRMKFSTTKDVETIFLYDGSHLISYSKGLTVNNVREMGSVGTVGNEFTFVKALNGNFGKFSVKCTDGGSYNNNYLYSTGNNNTNADRNTYKDSWRDNNSFTVEEIPSLPVTFKAAGLGYATFNCPVPVKIPSGVSAYVSKINGTKIKLYQIHHDNLKDGEYYVIPANTPVLLHVDGGLDPAGDDYEASFVISDYDGEGISGDDFYGTIAAEAMGSGTYYSLRAWTASGDTYPSKVGFYTKSGNLAGFKAWIHDDSSSARNFTIVFDGDEDPTGIVEALGLENDNVEIYDLNGRKLSSYKKGINIVNGKKVMIQ